MRKKGSASVEGVKMRAFFWGLLVGMGIIWTRGLVKFLDLVEERRKRIVRERGRIMNE